MAINYNGKEYIPLQKAIIIGRNTMIQLGKYQELEVKKTVDFGVYLGTDGDERVLLPARQAPDGAKAGDKIQVFIYRDSKDRLIATTNHPKLTLGDIALLQVKETTRVGAFLDWGLEKDLLLPFKEQTRKVEPGDNALIALYTDKSNRLCGTMKIYDYLKPADCYKKDDEVCGIVYEINPQYGAFVAVDLKYHGMIPKKDLHGNVSVGDNVHARVTDIRDDGKLNLNIRKKSYLQMEDDAEIIMEVIAGLGGELPYTDKASPEIIERDFGMSKAAFKRAIGKLLKENRVIIGKNAIKIQ